MMPIGYLMLDEAHGIVHGGDPGCVLEPALICIMIMTSDPFDFISHRDTPLTHALGLNYKVRPYTRALCSRPMVNKHANWRLAV